MSKVFKKTLVNCNIIEAWAGSEGKGSDQKTYLKIKDGGATQLEVSINGNKLGNVDEIELLFTGSAENCTFREALEFALGAYSHCDFGTGVEEEEFEYKH